mmetsp:Transcript_80842/g.228836  ORF Transcript_80842/g.228836 Transcript_80842/m.228836 type:complete len:213 (-) Transcript_80842:1229-1867(-)
MAPSSLRADAARSPALEASRGGRECSCSVSRATWRRRSVTVWSWASFSLRARCRLAFSRSSCSARMRWAPKSTAWTRPAKFREWPESCASRTSGLTCTIMSTLACVSASSSSMVSLEFRYGTNCWRLEVASTTSARAERLLLMALASASKRLSSSAPLRCTFSLPARSTSTSWLPVAALTVSSSPRRYLAKRITWDLEERSLHRVPPAARAP